MMIRSRNEKINGKRIESTIGKAKAVNQDKVSLRSAMKTVDEDRIAMIEVGSESNPPMRVNFDGTLDMKRLDGVFGPEEEGEIEIRGQFVYVTMGKNEYWFGINKDYDYREPKVPNLDEFMRATFTMDPSQLASLAKKADYVKIEAGTNKNGERTVFAAFYGKDGKFMQGIDLKTPWTGDISTSMFPASYVSKWGRLGKKAKARMGDNMPIELTGEDSGVEYRYLLAPRIECDFGDSDEVKVKRFSEGSFSDETERDWYASCNKKALPRNKNVVELDRQRILSIYGTPEKFRKEVDSVGTDAQSAIYQMFASCGDAYPRWMIADYLSTALGPDYKSYGQDEYDLYGRLMARDGMEIYRQAKAVSANRKGKGRKKQ